jgi:hypothetical protein
MTTNELNKKNDHDNLEKYFFSKKKNNIAQFLAIKYGMIKLGKTKDKKPDSTRVSLRNLVIRVKPT